MPPSRAGSTSRLRQRFQLAQALQQAGRVTEAAGIYREILQADPRHADALHYLGLATWQSGQPERGVRLIEQAIAIKPRYAEAQGNLGTAYAELGRLPEALACHDAALAVRPDLAAVHDGRGNILRALGRHEEAVASHDRAIALHPHDAGAFSNRGNALRDLHRYEEALASYDRAIALEPGFVEARCNRAALLHTQGHLDTALAAFDAIITSQPSCAEAHHGRGNVLRDLQRPQPALDSFAQAVALRPDFPEAHNDLGNALQDLRRYEDALSSHARAIALRPDFAEAHNNLGNALAGLQRPEEALASYSKAIAARPDYADAHYNSGNCLAAAQRMTAAVTAYDRAIALQPGHADALRGRGLALHALKRHRDALASYDRALALQPDMPWLPGDVITARRQICDWTEDTHTRTLEDRVLSGQRAAAPFALTFASESPALQKIAAEMFAASLYPDSVPAPPPHAGHERIRIGYFSADFRDHAMMHVMADLFACHDRSRFEITGFSLGPDTDDGWRQRIALLFDRFIDVRTMPDQAVAGLARDLEIDIAVDLMGFTMGARTGIFSHRAAPVQAAYLGFPATMGTPFIDYILADRIVIDPGSTTHYTEKIVYLPDSYQVNSRHAPTPCPPPERAALGLPKTGMVFCCFNSNYKIAPDTFAQWMRILRRVEDSVLWLYQENPDAAANLRREAAARHVSPERLIFAPRLPLSEHLARQSVADLFLDTLPYNGHATASLALWAGVPVLTRIGATFAGRVAASVLHAIGLPELVTASADAYEALAVEIATHPDRLRALRNKLADNRLHAPLFDTPRFARHIQTAFEAMHARALAGLPPAAIEVRDRA
jgi:protein O-GlcNAc transferase